MIYFLERNIPEDRRFIDDGRAAGRLKKVLAEMYVEEQTGSAPVQCVSYG